MTEAILIEIAQRRRKLEDLIEALKPHLDHESRALENRQREWTGDSSHAETQFAKWSRRIEKFEELRKDTDDALELCRDDMNRMADEIRKGMR